MKKAFTLVEIMIIISTIGILSAAITSFFSDTDRRQMLNAESCLNEMNASIKTFTNAAMTSKQLRSGNIATFPDYYSITFQPATPTSSWTITFTYENETESGTYQTIYLKWGCKRENVDFVFATGTTSGTIKMNSGFRQLKPDELFTFSFLSGANQTRNFTGEFQVNVCLDETCSKEFFKWVIDTRSQGIFTKKCLFYYEDKEKIHECKTREGDKIN